MKILILRAYYEPELAASSYLVSNLVEGFASHGHDVEIITPEPTRGVSDEVRKKYRKLKYEEKLGGKIKIHRFRMFREGKNPLARALRYLLCNVIHLLKGISIKNVDLIYTSSTPPTQGMLAAILKKFKKVPVLYSLQDIFPDSLINTKISNKDSLLYKIGRKVENYTYKNVDKIIVISNDYRNNLMSKGVPENKIEVVYNWVDENAITPIKKEENELFESLNLSRKCFYIVYAGNLGHAQNIDSILNAAKGLLDYTDIFFIIFGGGSQEKYYIQMADSLGLSNVKFFPLQPYSMVSYVYSLGDASIVSCKEGFGKSAMPSKTWSIMSAARAVIANFDEGTDLQRIIEENNAGIFTKSGDIDALKNAIIKLYEDRELCEKMGLNGRKFVMSNLTREIGTKKYIDIIQSIVR